MNDANQPPGLDEIACDWIARRDRGLTPQESADLLAWLESESHARAYATHDRTWKVMARAQAVLPSATLDALAQPRRARRWAPVAWISTAAAAAITLLFIQQQNVSFDPAIRVVETYSAPADAESRVALPDGSTAVLHRGARIAYGTFPSGRRVRLLKGEAHFTVSKLSPQPFFVHAGPVTVRDIGTAFNVRLDAVRVAVLVTEGRVEVRHDGVASASPGTAPGAAVLLTLGQEAIVETETPAALPERRIPAPAEVEQTMAWKRRRIKFDRMPLAAAIEELNRYNVRQLSIADPAIATVLIGGGVRADDLDAFVGLLQSGFGVAAESRGNEVILRKGN